MGAMGGGPVAVQTGRERGQPGASAAELAPPHVADCYVAEHQADEPSKAG
jgi:hypothetical protein